MVNFVEKLQESLGSIMPELLKPTPYLDLTGIDAARRRGEEQKYLSREDAQEVLDKLVCTLQLDQERPTRHNGGDAGKGKEMSVHMDESAVSVATLAVESLCYIVVRQGRKQMNTVADQAVNVLNLAYDAGTPLGEGAYIGVMDIIKQQSIYYKRNQHAIANRNSVIGDKVINLFASMVKAGIDPSPEAYERLIGAYASSGKEKEAIARIDGMLDVGLKPTTQSYNAVLDSYSYSQRWNDLWNFWLRMKEDGVDLNAQSFHPMMRWCKMTGQAEKAMFLLDELFGEDIEPTNSTFALVFQALGHAPHHVHGYEDIIFEAMGRYEGLEMVPDAKVYSAVIYAFARACDADAAMFYFEEMKRKRIKPNFTVYKNLLLALARNQAAGVGPYAYAGRYVPRMDPIAKDEDQEALINIGNERATELQTRGVTMEGAQYSSKGVRKKPVPVDALLDAAEGDPGIYGAEMMEAVRDEAKQVGSWRMDELRRREEEVYQRMRAPSYPGYYDPTKVDGKKVKEVGGTITLPTGEDGADEELEFVEPEEYLKELEEVPAAGLTEHVEDDDPEMDELLRDLMASEEQEEWLASDTGNNDPAAGADAKVDDILRLAKDVDLLSAGKPREKKGGEREAPKGLWVNEEHDDLDLDALSLNEQWELVEFGRAGVPDYSEDLFHKRWPRNKKRMRDIMKEMIDEGHNIRQSRVLNLFLNVYTEGKDRGGAYQFLKEEYSDHRIAANVQTYDNLIRMHVRRGEVDESVALMDEMRAVGLIPLPDSFGLVIHTMTKRDQIVEALKMLEEASYQKTRVPEKSLRMLRRKCEKLGVKHPDMPVNPEQWLQDMKEARKQLKTTGQKKVHSVRSAAAW